MTDSAPRAVMGVALLGAFQALESSGLFTGCAVLIFVLLERKGVRANRTRLTSPQTGHGGHCARPA